MPSVSANAYISRARRVRRPRVRAERRVGALAGAAAFALAVAIALSIASITGVGLATAAVERARSLADLLHARSPGARLQGQLSNTKHKHRALADRDAPAITEQPLRNLAEALAPPTSDAAAIALPPAMPELALQAPTEAGLFLLPSGGAAGGGGGSTPGGGGGTGPGGGGTPGGPSGPHEQPPLQPQQPPPVPEPGTWMMMILGFGVVGWALRRSGPAVAAA